MTFQRTAGWTEMGGAQELMDPNQFAAFQRAQERNCAENPRAHYEAVGESYALMRPDEVRRGALREGLEHVTESGDCTQAVEGFMVQDERRVGYSSEAFNRRAAYVRNSEELMRD